MTPGGSPLAGAASVDHALAGEGVVGAAAGARAGAAGAGHVTGLGAEHGEQRLGARLRLLPEEDRGDARDVRRITVEFLHSARAKVKAGIVSSFEGHPRAAREEEGILDFTLLDKEPDGRPGH